MWPLNTCLTVHGSVLKLYASYLYSFKAFTIWTQWWLLDKQWQWNHGSLKDIWLKQKCFMFTYLEFSLLIEWYINIVFFFHSKQRFSTSHCYAIPIIVCSYVQCVTSSCHVGHNDDGICKIALVMFWFLVNSITSVISNYIHQVTSKLQICPDITFIGRNREYRSTVG